MKRLGLIFGVLLIAAVALVAQTGIPGFVTVPPNLAGGQSAVILRNTPLTAATASISATTLLKAPADGTYRISIMGNTTVLGTGATTTLGYHTVTATFTSPVATASAQTVALGVLTLGSGTSYNGVLGTTPLTTGPGFYVFRAKAGTAIQITTTLTAAGGSPAPEPNIVITPIVESLGT